MKHLKAYVTKLPLPGMNDETANIIVQKFMINAARSIGGKNLEDLDEFSRDYLLKVWVNF